MYLLPTSLLQVGVLLASKVSRDPYIPFLQANDPKELLSCYLDHMNQDWTDDVLKISSPVIFRFGKHDHWIKHAGIQAISNSGKKVITNAESGHPPPGPEELWHFIQQLTQHNSFSKKTTST